MTYVSVLRQCLFFFIGKLWPENMLQFLLAYTHFPDNFHFLASTIVRHIKKNKTIYDIMSLRVYIFYCIN